MIADVWQQYCPYGFCFQPFWVGTWEFEATDDTQAQTSIVSMTISRYTSSSLSELEVDGLILPSATEILQTDDGTDVSCPIAYQRDGGIGVFTDGDGTIDDSTELGVVMAVPGRVQIVNQINWCGGPPSGGNTITGCASGAGMTLRRWDNEGIIWAHEYGHNQSLSHNSNSGWVMHGTLSAGNRRVTQFECDAMRYPLN